MNKLFKKLLITATAILSVICYSTTVAFAAGFDVNNDDSVNVNDVTFLQGEISEFTDNMDYDLNSDGRIDVNDVSFLQIEISNQSVENNTQISISTKEYCKNVGDTFTISVDTNNDVNEITFTSSDSSVAKIISTEKSLAKVKVNKVGNASVTIKQCNKIITTKVKVEKAKCIDVSEWNGDINFNKVKSAGITCFIPN
ncbi:hypothetical protein [Ruminococcus sp.]|mgnify:FL=1|jgi:hypothetical protein|uniref:hypothetical protein n=1 Tax=Ruminococcus sp. TaxID=41978 RepID=UPI003FD7C601